VVAERGEHGLHLVGLDESGDRQFELVRAPTVLTRDLDPVISPDGRWIVFASSRGRDFAETSLWIAPTEPDAVPTPLLPSRASDASPGRAGLPIESHAAWRPDGRGIVFDSTRAHGEFDLWELAIDHRGHAVGAPRQLTSAPGHEVTPTIARDGSIIYAAVSASAGKVSSHLERRRVDGTIEQLTPGPADASPALSPDGTQLVFSRPAEHNGALDSELYIMPVSEPEAAVPLVDVTLTDETGPVYSHDGRYVFATSVLRGARGNVVFSSVIVIDLAQHPRVARLLQDRTGPIARITPALAPITLDARALAAAPDYLVELARITASAAAAAHL
jgi:Tol biopolymer transport system component